MRKLIWILAVSSLLTCSRIGSAATPLGYHLLREIPIGGDGGWDYLSVDPSVHQLYMSQATRIVVVDLVQNKVVGVITDTPGVHGFAIAHKLGRGFSSNGKESKISIIDLKTLKTLSKSSAGENPDAILYEDGKQEVYAFNGRSKSATVIDAKTGAVVTTIALAGKPEFGAADPEAHRVYVNIEDKSQITAINTDNHQIVANWPIAPGETPTGLSIDLDHHRLLVGCENKTMIQLDSQSGSVLSSLAIGSGVDATVYDPQRGLAFSSNGEGSVTIVREHPEGRLELVQTLKTEPGARTMALDPETHRIYLPSAKFDDTAPAEGHHRKIVPGSIKLLVYGP